MNKFVFLLMLAFLPIVVNNRVCAASFNGTAPVTDALQPQDATDEVTLMVSADGETKDEAVKTALRSAIEQAYGTFVSANTTILNDALVMDEIVSVASGNIKEYKEMSAEILPNGRTTVMLQATVSISKLINYAQSKGAETEFAGATFAMNIKMKELNRVNEEKTIENLLKQMDLLLDNGFNYTIETANPTINGGYGIVEATVTATANANAYKAFDLLFMTLQNLSLKDREVEEYKSLKLPYYDFLVVGRKGKSFTSSEYRDAESYKLRSENTLKLLKDYFGTYYLTKLLSFSVNTDSSCSQIKVVSSGVSNGVIGNGRYIGPSFDDAFIIFFPDKGFGTEEDLLGRSYYRYRVGMQRAHFCKIEKQLLNYISFFDEARQESRTSRNQSTETNILYFSNLIYSGDVYDGGGPRFNDYANSRIHGSAALVFSNIVHKFRFHLKIPMEDFMTISKFTITPIKE